MLFGLTNALATFMDLMNRVFQEYLDKFIVVFIDDVLTYSKNVEEYEENFKITLQLLKNKIKTKIKINMPNFKKCEFWLDRVVFLEHVISKEGILVDPTKIEALSKQLQPKNVMSRRSFLGLFGYYKRFVEEFSKIDIPFTMLTRKNSRFEWSKACEKSF